MSYDIDTSAIEAWSNTMGDLLIVPDWVRDKPTAPRDIFAPASFDEYIGQEGAKSLAKIMVEAARKENRPLPNIMVVGDYGLGKTSLARLILREFGEPDILLDGASVNKELPSGHVIIDEIHNLTPDVADTLNISLDQGRLHIIGCTTNPGALPSAFRSRFRTLELEIYNVSTLTKILSKVVDRKGVIASKSVLDRISIRSRNNARQAIMYLALVFDIMAVRGQNTVTERVCKEAFERLGVDEQGFMKRDYRFLAAFPSDGRAVGLQFLSAVTGVDEETIQEEIEPYLMRLGFLDRTPRGRVKLKDI